MIRRETRSRARALQMLYAWELQQGAVQGTVAMHDVASGLARLTGPEPRVFDGAEALATAVLQDVGSLDREATAAADNWRLGRIAAVERNILRLGIHELRQGAVPPKVAIDEAVRLARWFAGARAPGFVNGVLDQVARRLGRL
jgi:N utilization substance protein B